jgi:Adenosylmethionine-8-amino-7-oxononanoate aminotransferase
MPPLSATAARSATAAADAATLAEWDRTHVWHAFTQMAEYEPLLIERGEGAALFDTDGNRYLDGSASMWCNVHGHHHPRLDRAAHEQLDKVAHTTNLGLSNPVTVRLAKRLTEIAPKGLEKVFFSDDGATAIEVALKMAFQFWRQTTACNMPAAEGHHAGRGLPPFAGAGGRRL